MWLPAAPTRVHAPRDEFVEMLDELRINGATIEEDRVVVIRLDHREQDVDAESLRCHRETVGERIVRLVVRSQQELTLSAPPRQHVKSWKDLTWPSHGADPSNLQAIEELSKILGSSEVGLIDCVRHSDAGQYSPPQR